MLKLRNVYGMDLVKKGVKFNNPIVENYEVLRCHYDSKIQERHELNGGRVLTHVNHYTAYIKDNDSGDCFTLSFKARGVDGEFTYSIPSTLIRHERYYQSPRFLNKYIRLVQELSFSIRENLGEC